MWLFLCLLRHIWWNDVGIPFFPLDQLSMVHDSSDRFGHLHTAVCCCLIEPNVTCCWLVFGRDCNLVSCVELQEHYKSDVACCTRQSPTHPYCVCLLWWHHYQASPCQGRQLQRLHQPQLEGQLPVQVEMCLMTFVIRTDCCQHVWWINTEVTEERWRHTTAAERFLHLRSTVCSSKVVMDANSFFTVWLCIW